MNKELKALCEELTQDIKNAYESSVSLPEAEKLAAKFLYAQIQVADSLRSYDLDSRLRKSGVKAIRAAVRMAEVKKHDKKPTEAALEDAVNIDPIVADAQNDFDAAEVERQSLDNYLNIFKDAHIYFRGVARGRFE